MTRWRTGGCLLLLAAAPAAALGPHELLLLINDASPLSMEIANRYAASRGIPTENRVHVTLPDTVRAAEAEIAPDDARRLILDPARSAIAARGLGPRIRAWAYSADFPVRVRTSPPMSLHGFTLVRGEVPESGLIATGLFASALFRGPTRPDGPSLPSITFETLGDMLGPRMPAPAMSLAWCGARGLDRDAALRALDDAAKADAGWARGVVVFVTGADVRAKCREWQFEPARAELAELGVNARIVDSPPSGLRDVSGLMMGTAAPDPETVRSFLAGAVADHLTSHAAEFHRADQTKLSFWLRNGAISSSGTVVEPYAIWTKFPAARFFVHYARGCSLLESYYQATLSPVQLFMVGDPLAAPMARRFKIRVDRTNDGDRLGFRATADGEPDNDIFLFLLNSRHVAMGPANHIVLDESRLGDGHHVLRVVGYRGGPVRSQAFAELGFEIGRNGRAARILSPESGRELDGFRPLAVRIDADGGPAGMGLFAGGVKLAESAGPFPATVSIDPTAAGMGPVDLQAVAVYADGGIVRSPPSRVTFARMNRPPAVERVSLQRVDGGLRAEAAVTDPDGDTPRLDWFRSAWPGADAPAPADVFGIAEWRRHEIRIRAAPRAPFATALLPDPGGIEFAAVWHPDAGEARGPVGLVFGAGSPTNGFFFGWLDDRSAWAIGRLADGGIEVLASRGVPGPPSGKTRLTVKLTADGAVEGWADDEAVCRAPRADATLGRTGFLAGPPARFTAAAARDAATESGAAMLPAAWMDRQTSVWLRASDGFVSVWREEKIP